MVQQRTDWPEQSTMAWAHKRPNIAEKWTLTVVWPSLGWIEGARWAWFVLWWKLGRAPRPRCYSRGCPSSLELMTISAERNRFVQKIRHNSNHACHARLLLYGWVEPTICAVPNFEIIFVSILFVSNFRYCVFAAWDQGGAAGGIEKVELWEIRDVKHINYLLTYDSYVPLL